MENFCNVILMTILGDAVLWRH